MKISCVLRIISGAMLIAAIIFLSVALTHPELGTAFYVGDFYFGAAQWRACYVIYALVMILLFVVSFFNKKTKTQERNSSMINTIKNRVSIKNYSDREIPMELVEDIVEAGVWAPSGKNQQAVRFLVVTSRETVARLERLNARAINMPEGAKPFYNAPVVVSVFGNREVSTHVEDASLALGNMMNVAYSMGVDSCWIHRAKEMYESAEGREIARAAGIPDEFIGVGNCILGYRAESNARTPKDRVPDRVHYIK